VTLGHPFYVHQTRSDLSGEDDEGEWILSKNLRVGDLLKLVSGEWKPIVDIQVVRETRITYNFEVEKNHDYFVGRNGWVVHNQSQKLLTGLTSEPLNEAEKAAWKQISGKATQVANGSLERSVLTEAEQSTAARKYLSEAFNPRGSYPPQGVTNYQLDRANYMLNGGTAPGNMVPYLRTNGFIP
jgi:hypothetical protein